MLLDNQWRRKYDRHLQAKMWQNKRELKQSEKRKQFKEDLIKRETAKEEKQYEQELDDLLEAQMQKKTGPKESELERMIRLEKQKLR